jgi:hypothetical protein
VAATSPKRILRATHMRETKRRQSHLTSSAGQRGVAMAFVFVLIALLLLVAILVVTGALNAVDQAEAVGVKYGVLNSAEAAANLALNQLAEDPRESVGCVTGSLNGAVYHSCMGDNNLTNSQSSAATDYANGSTIFVPPKSAYIYGDATNNGSRKTYVEAIAQPAPPISMPPGAINAAQNINDLTPEPINQDPLHANDANIYANNNISAGNAASAVQGDTFAVGTDNVNGADGTTHPGSSPIFFPTPTQVTQAANYAQQVGQAGSNLSGAAITSGTYTGDMYINGDVDVSSGTVTFSNGTAVFINGNLCISGTGSLANTDSSFSNQAVMVVSGVMSSSGTGGYVVTIPGNTLLIVLGQDPGGINPCGSSATDALSLSPTAGVEPIGTVFAANGSVAIGGTGTVQGALDGGVNVDIGGSTGSTIQYDAEQAVTTMTTGTMTYTAYNQD